MARVAQVTPRRAAFVREVLYLCVFGALFGWSLNSLWSQNRTIVRYEACVEARRAGFITSELAWFDALHAAERERVEGRITLSRYLALREVAYDRRERDIRRHPIPRCAP